jgi:hypothetical protein
MSAKLYVGYVYGVLIMSESARTDIDVLISNLSWNTTDDTLREVGCSAQVIPINAD